MKPTPTKKSIKKMKKANFNPYIFLLPIIIFAAWYFIEYDKANYPTAKQEVKPTPEKSNPNFAPYTANK